MACCDLTLRDYGISAFGILYVIIIFVFPTFNASLTGVRNDVDSYFFNVTFPYPFALVFFEAMVCTFLFLTLNLCIHFLWPSCADFFGASEYKLNHVKIDPVTNEVIPIYGSDVSGILRPNLYFEDCPKSVSPNSSNVLSVQSTNSSYDMIPYQPHPQQQQRHHSSKHRYTHTTKSSGKTGSSNNIEDTSTILLMDTGHNKPSWILDRNALLKFKISCCSGLALGLNIIIVCGALFYVPTNIDFVFESVLLIIVTLLSRRIGEPHTCGSIVWATLAFIGMLPIGFARDPLHRYPTRKKMRDTDAQLMLGLCLDAIGDCVYIAAMIFTKKLCQKCIPSRFSYDNDREPNVSELAFFVSVWICIASLPFMVIFEFYDSELFVSNDSSTTVSPTLTPSPNTYLLSSMSDQLSDGNVIWRIFFGGFLMALFAYSMIGILAITSVITTAVITQLAVVAQVVFYYGFIDKQHFAWWKWASLGFIVICCVGYGSTRVLEIHFDSSFPLGIGIGIRPHPLSSHAIDMSQSRPNNIQSVQQSTIDSMTRTEHHRLDAAQPYVTTTGAYYPTLFPNSIGTATATMGAAGIISGSGAAVENRNAVHHSNSSQSTHFLVSGGGGGSKEGVTAHLKRSANEFLYRRNDIDDELLLGIHSEDEAQSFSIRTISAD